MPVRWTPGEAVPGTAVVHAEDPDARDADKNRDKWAYKLPTAPSRAGREGRRVREVADRRVCAGQDRREGIEAQRPGRSGAGASGLYDLLGLPPTPAEVDAFVSDQSPDAWSKLIDRLLASPQYGERWGRHWLDLRYAETHGYERDSAKPFAWRYRDYVIKSFNDDKPYDRFLKEQIAGDELDTVTNESMIATGYYRLGIWDDEPADRPLARYDVLDGIVSTTGSVVLGMSIGCARCHDHKKDPISAKDYYSLLAFFQDVSDMNVKNTKVFADAESVKAAQDAAVAQRAREADLYRQTYAIEQSFLVAAKAKGINLGERAASDLTDLSFKFYRDTWDKLPDFTNLKFEESGAIGDGLVSLGAGFTQRGDRPRVRRQAEGAGRWRIHLPPCQH